MSTYEETELSEGGMEINMDNGTMVVKEDQRIFNSVIENVDNFIRRQYLSELQNAKTAHLDAKLFGVVPGKNVRLFKIASLAYGTEDNLYEKISNIYNALSGFAVCQVLILDSDGYEVSLYLGVACMETSKLGTQFEAFKSSFLGNFPGGKISILSAGKNEKLLKSIFDEPGIKISAVSALSVSGENAENSILEIEKLIDGMYGRPFTMLLLAESSPLNELRALRQSMEAMYTELSPYKSYTLSISDGENQNYTESYNLTKSESVTEGTSITENTTFGKSKNKSTATQILNDSKEQGAKNQLIGTAASLAAIMSGFGGKEIGLLQGLFYGGSFSNIISSAQVLINGAENMITETSGEGENYSVSFSEAETTSRQKGFSTSKGISDSRGKNIGKSIQMAYENKSIHNLLDILEQQIGRLQHIESVGGFQCAAYFITGDYTTALTVANMYRSLLGNGNNLGQNNAINVWSDKYGVAGVGEYLKRFHHPKFYLESKDGYPTFTGATLISSDEIPMYASLPQKSLRGVQVTTHAEFARDIMAKEEGLEEGIEIGNIYHMGKAEMSKIHLSKSGLRGHMLVAGTTGMGKSNFCYGLLHELYQNNVKFMVVEPAKGEYHQVFGGLENVYTFGTNPNLMPLLRLNPFSFPDGVHVSEHIDRLLEIFNSCWPMYAAMPAVLKEGIEAIYKNCGYNLITGKTQKKKCFPNFSDLLEILPKIIKKSEFSGEVKGNYIGSLVTRVASLTNGLYGCVFSEDEIEPPILFDENVLIDLSRVGSSETKALIMGLLVMKLQEHRMSTSEMNMPLKHVTVLEEAHHLLKADTGSSAEGVNLRSMSMEMITNAIAEMRTYGEGYIIAEQSPAMLDLAVIRNTNTKVIFKLPERLDRNVVGEAMALTQEQIYEISKLECGVAVVYQSNWGNPVLSKINYYDMKNYQAFTIKPQLPEVDYIKVYSQFLAVILKDRIKGECQSSIDNVLCNEIEKYLPYVDESAKELIRVIQSYQEKGECHMSFADICRYIDRLMDSKKLLESCGDSADLEVWNEKAMEYVMERANLSEEERGEVILVCINIRANNSRNLRKLYFREFAYIHGKEQAIKY